MTVSLWGFSRILGYWSCNALFFHFYSFKMIPSWTLTCVLGLDHFLSDLSSRFSNSGIVTSLVNLLAFLVIEMLALDLSRSCTWIALLCASDSDRALLLLFWMLFLPQSDPSLHLFSGCTAFAHLLYHVTSCACSAVCVFLCQSSSVLRFYSQWCIKCATGTARLLIASILFLPLSSVLRINRTLLLYSFLIFQFHFTVLETIILIYTQVCVYSFLVQLLYFCVIICYYVSS